MALFLFKLSNCSNNWENNWGLVLKEPNWVSGAEYYLLLFVFLYSHIAATLNTMHLIYYIWSMPTVHKHNYIFSVVCITCRAKQMSPQGHCRRLTKLNEYLRAVSGSSNVFRPCCEPCCGLFRICGSFFCGHLGMPRHKQIFLCTTSILYVGFLFLTFIYKRSRCELCGCDVRNACRPNACTLHQV